MADQHPSVLPAGEPTSPGAARSIPVLATLAAALIIGLTAAAMWLSYEHLHDVARAHGLIDPARSWAWPATVDTFIAAGEVLILRASLARTVDWWAISLTAVGSLGSIALNIAGVGRNEAGLDYVVAAVPPVVSLLAFGALMNQLHRLLTKTTAAPATASTPVERLVVERADTPQPPVAPPAPPTARPAMAAMFRAPELPAATEPDDDPDELEPDDDEEDDAPQTPVYDDPRCAVVRRLYDAGRRPGTAAIGDALAAAGYARLSPSMIRGVIRAKVEAAEPHLALLPAEPSQLRRTS